MNPCALYRHFDEAGVLLYVGISDDPSIRSNQHAKYADWVPYATRWSGVWCADRVSAETAERDAIRDEEPVYNIQGAAPDQPARVRRYLDSRRFGHAYRKRSPEELVTLREAARESRGVVLTLRRLRRMRREPVEHFPSHAARTRLGVRLYSVEELQEWTEAFGGTTLHCSRAELRDVRRWHRRRQRRRTRGTRPVPTMTAAQWLDAHHVTVGGGSS